MVNFFIPLSQNCQENFMKLIISVFFLFMFGMLQGQTKFLNRPSKTQSATVLEKGILQLESAYELEISGESDEREKEISFPGIVIRYGLGWGVEFRFANQYETLKDELGSISGFTDMKIGSEIQLFKRNDKKTEVALMSHLFLPTGSDGISNERVGNETFVLVWHELTEEMGIEYNIGYSNLEDDSQKGDFVYSFVAEYEMNDLSGVFVETYGDLIEMNELEASIDLGLSYQFTDNFELDLAAGTGINHKMMFVTIGLSWRIGEEEDQKSDLFF